MSASSLRMARPVPEQRANQLARESVGTAVKPLLPPSPGRLTRRALVALALPVCLVGVVAGTASAMPSRPTAVVGTNGPDVIDLSQDKHPVEISGLRGNDVLTGSRSGDLISGGLGNDVIVAGYGDELSGGRGDDRFVVHPADLSHNVGYDGSGGLLIVDFQGGGSAYHEGNDLLVLSGFGVGAHLEFAGKRAVYIYRVFDSHNALVGKLSIGTQDGLAAPSDVIATDRS
jgi:hypothetical protein